MKSFLLGMVLVLGFVSNLTAAQAATVATSKYSSLEDKDCNLLNSSDDEAEAEIDYFNSLCPGHDGYQVKLLGGDIRSWVGILKPGEKYKDGADFYQALMQGSNGHFANVQGTRLEWRYNDGKLVAFIVRMIAQDVDDYEKSVESLVVVRTNPNDFSKSCLIGSVNVRVVADANVVARQIADDASKPCL